MFPLDDFARAAAADENSYLRKIRKNGRIGANQLLWDLDVDDAFNDTLVQEKDSFAIWTIFGIKMWQFNPICSGVEK